MLEVELVLMMEYAVMMEVEWNFSTSLGKYHMMRIYSPSHDRELTYIRI